MKKSAGYLLTSAVVLLMVLSFFAAPAAQAGGFTPTPALAGTTTPTPAPVPVYALVNVPDRGTLNIRSGPGTDHRIIGAYGPQQKDIPLTGRTSGDAPKLWYEVRRSGGRTGWISGYYVTEYVKPDVFCADKRVETLIADLADAIKREDGRKLDSLTSPLHGLTVRLWRTGVAINYLRYVPNLFASTYAVDWGAQPGTGKHEVKSFTDAFVPRLHRVFDSSYEIACNDAARTGWSSSPWPPEYATINYYAVSAPASAGSADKPPTWLVGVDYVDGLPHLFALIHFQP